jgi:hypothetical protein
MIKYCCFPKKVPLFPSFLPGQRLFPFPNIPNTNTPIRN